MASVEEDKLLKLKGVSSITLNTNYLVQQKDTLSSSLLWHAHFGRTNYESIRIMGQQGIKGLPIVPRKLTPCNACILGKHHKKSFQNSTSRATRKLSFIHSDLCGPMPIPIANGNKYILTFINDYSRMCWVYLLKEKSQVSDVFKKFHLLIKNEAQVNIGTIRTDNRGEYTSHVFEKYLEENGIKH